MNNLLAKLLRQAGAVACGVAKAEPVADTDWRRFEQWLADGFHAGMAYMENYPEIRRDPRLLLPGARSVVSVAFNYRQPNPLEGLATYALGEDYHKVLRRRLKRVVREAAGELGGDWRICIDSAPILERYWAVRCGVGRRSDNHGNVNVAGAGSMVFLAELITTLSLEEGSCNFTGANPIYIEEPYGRYPCPTGALQAGGCVDSRRCINYLTIEHRGELSSGQRQLVGKARFGCDICLRASAENLPEPPAVIPEFLPLRGLEEFLEGKTGDFPLEKSPIKRKKC
ncbi:MAG: DUF1730 domain-containing protein [Muribaculaceae bacterium]|nr:DUF1730 domain-containing protein [Muribaculaceae bacterium]